MSATRARARVALIEAGSPSLNIYSHVAMGRGVPLLATVLRDAGYDVRAYVEDISGKGTVDWKFVSSADVVGFSAITCTLPRTGELLTQLRLVNPSAVAVFGGPEPTCDPERSLALGADFVLRGEAEITLPQLLETLSGVGTSRLDEIPGLMWREEGGTRCGPEPVQLDRDRLDALPLVDRSLIYHGERSSVASVWRTRGCPERCDFCEVCEIWPKTVLRSEDKTIDELMSAQSSGYATTFLIDDNAAANKPAFKRFLENVASSGYARMLVTQLRADAVFKPDGRLDRELLRLLKKAAGVTIICVGVESAADEDLEQVHKKIDSKRMAKALRAMRRYGMLVHGMFIALAEDTTGTIKRNGNYARRYVTSLQYLFETPLPGTKRTKWHEDRGGLLFEEAEDLRFYDGMHVVIKPDRMTPTLMEGLVAREYRRFYSIRRIVAEALNGTFVRFRRLTEGQRRFIAELPRRRRLRTWLRFHVEYKYAPVAFLATGWARVRNILRDPERAEFTARLRDLEAGGHSA